jgi:hypothetical protein
MCLLAIAALGLLAVACGGGDDDAGETVTPSPTASAGPVLPNPPGNLLRNAGFEEGPEPWISLNPESSFVLSTDAAFTGTTSALLQMRDGPESTGTRIYYLVQEVTPLQFPEVMRGAYRVLNWSKGTEKQYLQAVVIVFGADNNPVPGADNFQVRYLLAGVDEAPLEIGNARYLSFSSEEPVEGSWLGFETNVMDDFEEQWGVVPAGFEKIRVLFEVRFDEKVATDGTSQADVFYDDLYLGSAN